MIVGWRRFRSRLDARTAGHRRPPDHARPPARPLPGARDLGQGGEAPRGGGQACGSACPPRSARFAATAQSRRSPSRTRRPASSRSVECEALILLLGFHSHLGSIADWGLELHGKRQILVEPKTMETSLPGVYAAGRRRGLRRKDHAHLRRIRRGRDRCEQCHRADPRREGSAEVLDRLTSLP